MVVPGLCGANPMLNQPVHWRLPGSPTPFGAGEYGRPLRIVVDEDALAPSDALSLLWSFSEQPTAEIYGTKSGRSRRVKVADTALEEGDSIWVDYELPTGRGVRRALWVRWISEAASMTANEFGVDPDESRRSLLLAHACATHPVDAFVTESPTLRLDYWRNLRTKAHVMGPVQAIALLGLHLRAHERAVSPLGTRAR
jgi:hypothetical protein